MIEFLRGTVGKDYFSSAWVGWELELNGRLKELPSIPCITQGIETYRIEMSLYSTDESICLGFASRTRHLQPFVHSSLGNRCRVLIIK